jgi:ABC-2 type transport system permease protein
MRTVLFLIRKEYLQVFRDRAMVFLIFVLPLAQLLLLGNAATFEIRRTRVHVVDLDRTPASREVIGRLAASPNFTVARVTAAPDLADEDLRARRAALVVTVPRGFEENVTARRPAPVQLQVDAENGAAAGLVQAYASRILADWAADVGTEVRPDARTARLAAGAPAPGVPRLDVRTRGWYNPSLDYRAYMVPGVLVILVTLVGTLLTAMNIAREKEIGTLEQLNATPLARWQFVAGKLVPFWLLALVDLAVGLALAKLVFDIPTRGSVLLVFGCAAVYLLVALGIGLWISAVAETQQQAMFMSFFVVMIYLLMSGLFTPVDSMPRWAQLAAQLNPIKHFVVIMRSVLVKGAGPAEIAAPLGALAASAAVVLTLAVRQYSKTSA